MSSQFIAINDIRSTSKSARQHQLDRGRSPVKNIAQAERDANMNSKVTIAGSPKDFETRQNTEHILKCHNSQSQDLQLQSPSPSDTKLHEAHATQVTTSLSNKGKLWSGTSSGRCLSKKKAKNAKNTHQREALGVARGPVGASVSVHHPKKIETISKVLSKPANSTEVKHSLARLNAIHASIAPTPTATALSFNLVRVLSPASDASSCSDCAPTSGEHTNHRTSRVQPVREVKAVRSIEHEVDPLNPDQPNCDWAEPIVFDPSAHSEGILAMFFELSLWLTNILEQTQLVCPVSGAPHLATRLLPAHFFPQLSPVLLMIVCKESLGRSRQKTSGSPKVVRPDHAICPVAMTIRLKT